MFYSRAPKLFENCKSIQTSSPTSLLLCFSLPPATSCCTRRLTWHTHVTPELLAALFLSRWSFPVFATPPRPSARPPPRRRRGELGTEPRPPSSRAQQHQQNPLILFLSLPRQIPAPKPQNTTAARPNSGELDAAVKPPLQTFSDPLDPLESSTLGPRSSPASLCRQSLTGEPRRR